METINKPLQEAMVSRSVRTFVLTAIGLSLVVWDLSFNLGVYKTVFYGKYFTIWVICTVVLLANFFLPRRHRYLGFWGFLAMLSPTLWFVLQFWQYVIGVTGWMSFISFWITFMILLICLPYGAYIVVSFTQADALKLRPRSLFASLVAITVIIASLGYTVGIYHPFFLTCEAFQVAGDNVPKDCFPESALGKGLHLSE